MTNIVVYDDATNTLINPTTGELTYLTDTEGVADWYRTITDIETTLLKPAKRRAADALLQAMDTEGTYTLHLNNNLTITGTSLQTWENQTRTDTDRLHRDLLILRQRAHPLPQNATITDAISWEHTNHEWVDAFFKTTRLLTAAGRNRLERMSGPYATALHAHTTIVPENERGTRKAPTVTRSNP